MENIQVYDEGGINWSWYTKLAIYDDKTVTIIKHWREHKGDESSIDARLAKPHSNYYHDQMWKEDKERTALEYFVPGMGWYKIRNQGYIFELGWKPIPVTIFQEEIPAVLTE